jgi:N-acetylmuramoyl-L-alanine amidase
MTNIQRQPPTRTPGRLAIGYWTLVIAFAASVSAREIRLPDMRVPTRVIQGVEYAPLVEMVSALGGNVWQVDKKLIAILPPGAGDNLGYQMVFTQGRNRVLVNGRPVMLAVPFQMLDNEVYVPAAFLNQLFPMKLSRMPQVMSMSLAHVRDTSVLRVETDTAAYYSWIAVTSTCFRIYVQADCRMKRLDPTGLVRRIDFAQRNGTELVINTTEPSICRLSREGASVVVRLTPRQQRRIREIVIDPGHGGKDPGALGRRLKEKDVNVDVAERLRKRLKQASRAQVILTRDRDEYVTLGDRARRANAEQADLFISVHCNSAPDNAGAQGFETYFLSPARTDWERAVMSRENAALDFAVPDTDKARAEAVASILRDLAQNEFLKESEQLATNLQAAASTWLRGKDRGVKQADFAVLRNAYMPAVLVECGFLTNPAEEKLLGASDYRERIATALATGIMQFVAHVENQGRQ